MIKWHKKYVEKTLVSWGLSIYQGYWISFLKGLTIGRAIVYFYL
jgi:hypothetical protein